MVSVLRACLVAASFLWLVVVCISTGVDHGTHAVEVSGTVAQPQGDAPVTADSSVQPVDEDKVGTPEQKNTKKQRKSIKTKTKKSKKNKKKNKKRKKGKKKRSKKKGSAAQKLTGKGTKQMPAGAMKAKADAHDAAMPMFMCTACERAADSVSNALSRRLLAGDTWSIETDNLLWDDIRGTCMNPKLFPRSSRILHEACVKFFNKYTDAVR